MIQQFETLEAGSTLSDDILKISIR